MARIKIQDLAPSVTEPTATSGGGISASVPRIAVNNPFENLEVFAQAYQRVQKVRADEDKGKVAAYVAGNQEILGAIQEAIVANDEVGASKARMQVIDAAVANGTISKRQLPYFRTEVEVSSAQMMAKSSLAAVAAAQAAGDFDIKEDETGAVMDPTSTVAGALSAGVQNFSKSEIFVRSPAASAAYVRMITEGLDQLERDQQQRDTKQEEGRLITNSQDNITENISGLLDVDPADVQKHSAAVVEAMDGLHRASVDTEAQRGVLFNGIKTGLFDIAAKSGAAMAISALHTQVKLIEINGVAIGEDPRYALNIAEIERSLTNMEDNEINTRAKRLDTAVTDATNKILPELLVHIEGLSERSTSPEEARSGLEPVLQDFTRGLDPDIAPLVRQALRDRTGGAFSEISAGQLNALDEAKLIRERDGVDSALVYLEGQDLGVEGLRYMKGLRLEADGESQLMAREVFVRGLANSTAIPPGATARAGTPTTSLVRREDLSRAAEGTFRTAVEDLIEKYGGDLSKVPGSEIRKVSEDINKQFVLDTISEEDTVRTAMASLQEDIYTGVSEDDLRERHADVLGPDYIQAAIGTQRAATAANLARIPQVLDRALRAFEHHDTAQINEGVPLSLVRIAGNERRQQLQALLEETARNLPRDQDVVGALWQTVDDHYAQSVVTKEPSKAETPWFTANTAAAAAQMQGLNVEEAGAVVRLTTQRLAARDESITGVTSRKPGVNKGAALLYINTHAHPADPLSLSGHPDFPGLREGSDSKISLMPPQEILDRAGNSEFWGGLSYDDAQGLVVATTVLAHRYDTNSAGTNLTHSVLREVSPMGIPFEWVEAGHVVITDPHLPRTGRPLARTRGADSFRRLAWTPLNADVLKKALDVQISVTVADVPPSVPMFNTTKDLNDAYQSGRLDEYMGHWGYSTAELQEGFIRDQATLITARNKEFNVNE